MTKISKVLGYANLSFVFISFGMAIHSLTESDVNLYKTGLWSTIMVLNMISFSMYMVNRD